MIHNNRLNAIGQKILSPVCRDDFKRTRDISTGVDNKNPSKELETIKQFLELCEKDASGEDITELELARLESRV